MMKFLTFVLVWPLAAFASNENILVVDSSFPEVKADGIDLTGKECELITEEPLEIPLRGSCVNDTDWGTLKSVDENLLKGLQDVLAKKDSPYAKKWQAFEIAQAETARNVKVTYALSAHGARSAFIASKNSGGTAKVFRLRVMSAQAGAHQQSGAANYKTLPELATKRYADGCSLVNWAPSDVKSFENGKLLPYLERLALILETNPAIRVVNVSLGYRLSYIKEDNAKCSEDKATKDFKTLQQSWKSLFRKYNDRLFLVAAGNEGEDLGAVAVRNDDLWASLSAEPNLLIVGSLNLLGERFPTSNYGSVVSIMAPGENLEVKSPLPRTQGGHATTVRGTSFSSPLVAGRAVKILSTRPALSISELKKELIKSF